MDHQKTGVVTFEDFAHGLSILIRGSLEDRLRWTFQMYDVNKDGVVSEDELKEVTASVSKLFFLFSQTHLYNRGLENEKKKSDNSPDEHVRKSLNLRTLFSQDI